MLLSGYAEQILRLAEVSLTTYWKVELNEDFNGTPLGNITSFPEPL